MVITFNYKEGTKTITFAELQDAISNKNGSDLDCLAAPPSGQAMLALILFIMPPANGALAIAPASHPSAC